MNYLILILAGVVGIIIGKVWGTRYCCWSKKQDGNGGNGEKNANAEEKDSDALKQSQQKKENKEKILEFLQTNGKITNDEAEKMLGVSNNTAERYLDELEKEGLIIQHGTTGRAVFYAFPAEI